MKTVKRKARAAPTAHMDCKSAAPPSINTSASYRLRSNRRRTRILPILWVSILIVVVVEVVVVVVVVAVVVIV